ncbi:HNH endonuclease [Streptomyces phage Tribute]|uniref:HNH endonuclease n=1 Tax=Streptomyces phage Tribute TaxID=2653772 RepID=A0A5Q2WIP0_9CAUD|nr:HNH endonuclease [Streptomyces phage Tribute]
MKSNDLAWLAGLLEGEGSFMTIKSHVKGKVYLYPKIVVTMTDLDVIQRAATLLGNAVYNVPLQKNGVSKLKQYQAQISGAKAADLMKELLPHMGRRRSEKIREILKAYGKEA